MLRAYDEESVIAEDWADAALAPPADPAWRMDEPGYQMALEHDVETRFTVGNGRLGVRGSLEQPTIASRPRTFIAGLFDTPPADPVIPALVPGPDWLRFQLTIDGAPLSFDGGETLAHTRTLDMGRGVLLRAWRWRDKAGRVVRLRTLRFASLANRALAVQLARITVEQPAVVCFEAWLASPAQRLLLERRDAELTVWRAAHAERRLALAHGMTVRLNGAALPGEPRGDEGRRWSWAATPGQPATFVRIVSMARGDVAHDPGAPALVALHRARRSGPARLLAAHERAWAERRVASDVVVEGDNVAQRALRFAVYHLNSATNPDDERVSIGARALTGDAYLGHVFWDTEIFLLPFYTFTWPAAARALLMYRIHTLPAARAKATRLGYRGAVYAWESADSGDEATPPYVVTPDGQVVTIRCGTDEQHISADVAYAVWQYWQVTGDAVFLRDAGAEIVLETARFWASRAMLEADGRYHIRNVIGPDEYHEGVDDNAFTNELAQWNLERGLEVAQLLLSRWPDRWLALQQSLSLSSEVLDVWRDVASRLVTGLDEQTGLFEQFAGYFGLEPIDLAVYEPRTAPMDVLLGRERTQRSQVIKQADVVMLLALLWDRFTPEQRAANFRYYEPRSGHGSSLSPAMHALVAARLGDMDLAERYFRQAAAIDLDDTMGNAAGGVHIATLGGLWQATVFGFAGLSLCLDGIRLDPHLPRSWGTLRFPVQWRGRRIRIDLQQEPLTLTVTIECGRPLTLYVGELVIRLGSGQSWTGRLDRRDPQSSEVLR